MNKEKVDEILKRATFQEAKTMKNIPHHYTLVQTWKSRAEFEELVQFMRDNGVEERFFSRTFTYYYANGYKYWTMGFPLNQTRLINRAIAETPKRKAVDEGLFANHP